MTQTLTNSSQLNYDTTANIPLADETDRGAVIKATDAEVDTWTDDTKYLTSDQVGWPYYMFPWDYRYMDDPVDANGWPSTPFQQIKTYTVLYSGTYKVTLYASHANWFSGYMYIYVNWVNTGININLNTPKITYQNNVVVSAWDTIEIWGSNAYQLWNTSFEWNLQRLQVKPVIA